MNRFPKNATASLLSRLVTVAVAMVACASHPLSADEPEKDSPVSYRTDIRALLTKHGCNSGACHGNANGKGGFKLTLRGDFPAIDLKAILAGGRVVPKDPLRSPLLRKPALLAPHEGEKRFEKGSEEFDLLRRWIAAGAKDDPRAPAVTRLEATRDNTVLEFPKNSVQIKVTAHFANDTSRDVTRWSLFDPSNLLVAVARDGTVTFDKPGETVITVSYLGKKTPVRLAMIPSSEGFMWNPPEPKSEIDHHVFAKLERLRINPSVPSAETTFLRRASLDIIGLPPTAEESKAFIADKSSEKRARLIDSLLARPEFADHWATKPADLLRIEEKVLDTEGVNAFHAWIRGSIAKGKPLDQFAREILSATGSTYKNPPANYYRALRKPNARAEAVAQVFLGTRISCAQCHDHPFDRWSQDDYYRFAALFDGVGYKILENKRRDKNDKNMFIGEQLVTFTGDPTVKHPRTGKIPQPGFLIQPATPASPAAPASLPASPSTFFEDCPDRLEKFAAWATSPEHPLFARVWANRVWFHLFGTGIVDPPDDFRSTNPPSNPALLDHLESEFVRSKFDLRSLIRHIANSTTYQLSSEPTKSNAWDTTNFSHSQIRRLDAEPLADAIHQFLDLPGKFNGHKSITRAAQLPGIKAVYRDRNPTFCDSFVKLFGRPARLTNSDSERTRDTSLAQVFTLTSSPELHDLICSEKSRPAQLVGTPEEKIEALFWAALSRPPTDPELRPLVDHLNKSKSQPEALQDITWALLNSKEFLLRR